MTLFLIAQPLPTVNRFLFNYSLQTGGYVIGRLAAIFSAFGVIGLVSTLAFVIIAGMSGEVDADDADDRIVG